MYSDKVIETLNEKFVCFASGWHISEEDPVYKAAKDRWYHKKTLPDEGSGRLHGADFLVMTSTGRLMEAKMKRAKDPDDLLAALAELQEAYAKLPVEQRVAASVESEAKPQPAPPEGGLVLAIYDRPLGRDEGGSYHSAGEADLNGHRIHAIDGQRDSLWLTAEESASLVPASPRVGENHPVPEKLARRIFLYGLIPHVFNMAVWDANSLKEGGLQLVVSDVNPASLRMRIHGSALLSKPDKFRSGDDVVKDVEDRYDSRLEGVIEVDRATGKIVRWDMAALGDYSGRTHVKSQDIEVPADKPFRLAFAFGLDETIYDLPPERRHPGPWMHRKVFANEVNEPWYWDPGLWLADWEKRQAG